VENKNMLCSKSLKYRKFPVRLIISKRISGGAYYVLCLMRSEVVSRFV